MSASNRRAIALATAAYAVLTIAYSWPLAARLPSGVAHDLGDPLLNTWILWWSTRALPLTAAWWNAPIFYPAPGTFAFSEHLLGLAPIAAPVIAATGNALLAYNVTLLASYVLSGLGAYFLAYTLTRRHDAAFVAGLAFAFAPYRLAQLPHIQVLCAYWTPACLAALHRYDRERTTKWAALAAGAWFMQAMSNGYYLLFLSVLLVLWFAWFAAGRWPLAAWTRIAGFFVVAAVLLLPVLAGYKRILQDTYDYHRGLEEIQHFSADAAGLLNASQELLAWGWLNVFPKPEGELFPGLALAALALSAVVASRPLRTGAESPRVRTVRRVMAALFLLFAVAALMPIVYGAWRLTIGGVRILSIARPDKPVTLALFAAIAWLATLPRVVQAARGRRPLLFYAAAAFAMWVLALGPDPTVMGHRLLYQAPYGWLMRAPGFEGLRVPSRFWMMSLACLSVLAAFAVDRLGGRTRRIVMTIAAMGLVVDGWPRAFTVLAAPDSRPTPPGVVARLELPMDDDHDAAAVYRQTREHVPIFNGFSGYAARHQYAMRQLMAASDARILDALTTYGPLGVIVDHASDPDGEIRRFVAGYPGAAPVASHQGWSSYRLPRNERPDAIPEPAGMPLAIKAVDAIPSPPHAPRAIDGDLKTRWSGGVQRQAADFTVQLEQPSHVGQVVIRLGEFMTDYPTRLRVEVSVDRTQWETVYLADTALRAYVAALHHPRDIPVVIPIDRDNVRFIRLQQTGWGSHDWSIAELEIRR
jgi:hypothetical protein